MKNKSQYRKKIEKISKIAKLDDANYVTDLKQYGGRTQESHRKKINTTHDENIGRISTKQQKHFLKIISGNFELSIKKTKNLKRKINDLREISNIPKIFLKIKLKMLRQI